MHEARILARARALPRAFLDDIARRDTDDAATHAAVAGLIVLRVIDRWVADGCRPGCDVRGARAAVHEMDAGRPARAILGELLDALAAAGPTQTAGVIERVMAYARTLEYDASWAMALAVYDRVIQYAGVASSVAAVAGAYLRQGYCRRTMGQFEQAAACYDWARRLAENAGDVRQVLSADLGRARIDAALGRLAEADATLRAVIDGAERARLPGLASMALHDRAVVAGMHGDLVAAVRLGYAALQICDAPTEAERILADIGEGLRRLGLRAAARDAFLVLSATAQERYGRWSALILLMRIAGDDGQRALFDEYRRMLDAEPLPPALQVDFALQTGYGLRALGCARASRAAFHNTARLARRHGFRLEVGEAERAIAGHTDSAEPARAPLDQGSELSVVVEALGTMRAETAAG